jgi:hypothetical protein
LRQYITELKKQRALDLPQFRENLTAQLAVERLYHYLQTDIPLLEQFEVFALQLIEMER